MTTRAHSRMRMCRRYQRNKKAGRVTGSSVLASFAKWKLFFGLLVGPLKEILKPFSKYIYIISVAWFSSVYAIMYKSYQINQSTVTHQKTRLGSIMERERASCCVR